MFFYNKTNQNKISQNMKAASERMDAIRLQPSKSTAETARETLCISDQSVSDRIADLERRGDEIAAELAELRPIKQALVQAIAMAGEAKMETALKELTDTLQQAD